MNATVTRTGARSTVRYTVTAGDVVLSFAANMSFHPSLSIAGYKVRWRFDCPSHYHYDADNKRRKKPAEYAEALKPWVSEVAALGSETRAKLLVEEQKQQSAHTANAAQSLKVASQALAAVERITR